MASVLTTVEPIERRQSRRVQVHGHHWLGTARVVPGRDVAVVNVSPGGALVEGETRLVPGAEIDLQLAAPEGRLLVRGRVLRCYVSRLTPGTRVRYRGAVVFEKPLVIVDSVDWARAERGCG